MKKTIVKFLPFLIFFIFFISLFIISQKETVSNDPISIAYLKSHPHPGGKIVIEKEIDSKQKYKRFIASYPSEGYRIKALMTIPSTQPPKNGFPVIIISHGDVPVKTYDRTKKYIEQIDEFSSNGYIVFMPDFRGYADSEGKATNAYAFPDYALDILNAVSSLKDYEKINVGKIGIWSHSSGAHTALRAMVSDKRLVAGVFWGPAVGTYEELLTLWPTYWEYTHQTPPKPEPTNPAKDWRAYLTNKYGSFTNSYWNDISATSYLTALGGPIQIHHAESDEWVPVILSKLFDEKLKKNKISSELYIYNNDDHNFKGNFTLVMKRTISFFDKYLKSEN